MAMLGTICSECCCPPCNHGTVLRLDCFGPSNAVTVLFGANVSSGDEETLKYSFDVGYRDRGEVPCRNSESNLEHYVGEDEGEGGAEQSYAEKPFTCEDTFIRTRRDLTISFTALPYCFGSGLSARAHTTLDYGPITQVELLSAGGDYARLGRKEPTLSIGNSHITAATVEIVLSEQKDECALDYWFVDEINIDDGGLGYVDEQLLDITVGGDGATDVAAEGSLYVVRYEPTVELSTAHGSGATFTVSVEEIQEKPQLWAVTEITFSGTTSGYVDGQYVTFSGDGLIAVSPPSGVVRTVRQQPTMLVSPDSVNGTGAALTAFLTSNANSPETWGVASATIDNAGTGYAVDDTFTVTATTGVELSPATLIVAQVGPGGEIEVCLAFNTGEFYDASDELDFVELTDGGAFYGTDGEIEEILITNGGRYYEEDADLPPYVQTVVGTVLDYSSGLPPVDEKDVATITAIVDEDTNSATFGQIASLQITEPGFYLGWEMIVDVPGYTATHIELTQVIIGYEPAVGKEGCVNGRKFSVQSRFDVAFDWIIPPSNNGPGGPDVGTATFDAEADATFGNCNFTQAALTYERSEQWSFFSVSDNYEGTGGQVPCLQELIDFLSGESGTVLKAKLTTAPCNCGSCELIDENLEPQCYSPVSEADCLAEGGTWTAAGVCNPLP